MKYVLAFILLVSINLFGSEQEKIQKKVNSLEKPLYNPFVENYILHEIKQLREENRNLKVELHETLAQKEVQISSNAINYATSTINNMFYIIAAASSIFVLIGWSSIKDMNDKIKNIVDEKVSKVISDYESRMHLIEKDLESRSRQVIQNQKDIQETNVIHSLWMRASQENTPSGKIELYDEILHFRPDDVEALTYKAEAILELGEANWSLSIVNQALDIDNNYANALYQRAKVYNVLGDTDSALIDLEKALKFNEQYIQEIENESYFASMNEDERFKELLNKYNFELETNKT